MQNHTQKILTLALASFASLAFAQSALAQPGSAPNNDALENARNNQPKFGGSAGYRMSEGMKLGARYDYGFKSEAEPNAAQSSKEQRAIQQNNGQQAGAHQHNGNCSHPVTGPKPERPILVKNGTSPGAGMSPAAPQKPGMMNGSKKKNSPKYKLDAYPFGAGEKGGFTEVSGLDFETQPIEYREGADNDFNKTKQPGMPKYSNINMSRPKDNGKFAETILTDVKFRIEVEEVKRKYYPEKKQPEKPVRGR